MITGKIILKSATKVSLDRRFGDIAKQPPPPPPPPQAPRFQQQANVTIPFIRDDLFSTNNNRQNLTMRNRQTTMNIAAQLKKRSISYRLGQGPGGINRQYTNRAAPRILQRVGFGGRRRGAIGGGASSYLFGGQSGMGVRLRGQGRIGTRGGFRKRTRGYLNNSTVSRFTGNKNNNRQGGGRFQQRGGGNPNKINRGSMIFRRGGGGGNRNNPTRGRGGGARNMRGGKNKNNSNNINTGGNVTKQSLDDDLEHYMAQTKLDTESFDMNAV